MERHIEYEDFLKVLDLAKRNSDSFEQVLQMDEKRFEEMSAEIASLKQKLEPFNDSYFVGLQTTDIAELAKKSLRLSGAERKCEYLQDCIDELYNKLYLNINAMTAETFMTYLQIEFLPKLKEQTRNERNTENEKTESCD